MIKGIEKGYVIGGKYHAILNAQRHLAGHMVHCVFDTIHADVRLFGGVGTPVFTVSVYTDKRE